VSVTVHPPELPWLVEPDDTLESGSSAPPLEEPLLDVVPDELPVPASPAGSVMVQCEFDWHVAPSAMHLQSELVVHQPSCPWGSVPAGTHTWPAVPHWQT
jgi:hypothetical protein